MSHNPYRFEPGDWLFHQWDNSEELCTYLGKSSVPGLVRVHFAGDGDVYHVMPYFLRRA